MQCYFCQCDGSHNKHCPKLSSDRTTADALWKAGYDDGRNRREAKSDADPTYMIGWVRGDAVADTSENVFE